MSLRVFVHVLLAVSLLAIVGCDEQGEAAEPTSEKAGQSQETTGDGEDCDAEALKMAKRLEPFVKQQPEIDVPFELTEATGKLLVDGEAVLVGADVIRVGTRTFEVSEDNKPIEEGRFSEELVERVRNAVVGLAKREAKKAKLLKTKADLIILLGVHPDIPASAVKPFFIGVEKRAKIGLLAFDADAPAMPERKKAEQVEPLLEKLSAAESKDEIEELTRALEKQVLGDCRIAFFRIWMGDKTGQSTLDRDQLLDSTPLADAVVDCGCEDVDLDGLEASLGWAMTPPHGPLVMLPSNFGRAFGNPKESWSDVVERHE